MQSAHECFQYGSSLLVNIGEKVFDRVDFDGNQRVRAGRLQGRYLIEKFLSSSMVLHVQVQDVLAQL